MQLPQSQLTLRGFIAQRLATERNEVERRTSMSFAHDSDQSWIVGILPFSRIRIFERSKGFESHVAAHSILRIYFSAVPDSRLPYVPEFGAAWVGEFGNDGSLHLYLHRVVVARCFKGTT